MKRTTKSPAGGRGPAPALMRRGESPSKLKLPNGARRSLRIPGGDAEASWQLTPEAAAVHEEERVAVISDVHLGYEWARGSGGDALPAHSLHETLAKLSSLLDLWAIERLVVAGDLVESSSYCRRTAADVRALVDWLRARSVELVRLQGNHDPPSCPVLPRSIELAGWTIAHGDRPVRGARTIIGHHHPALRAKGIMAPCFLYSADAIVLPAFSPNAAGFDVAGRSLPRSLRHPGTRCAVALGGEIFEFGPIADLASRLARA